MKKNRKTYDWRNVFREFFNKNKAGGSSRWLVAPNTVQVFIEGVIEREVEKTEKAYGGCKNCYGKGYATTLELATEGAGDFKRNKNEGRKFQLPFMRFCSCGRGKQLMQLWHEGEGIMVRKILQAVKKKKWL